MKVSPELHARLRAAISDAYYEARNLLQTMESAADVAADHVATLIEEATASLDEETVLR